MHFFSPQLTTFMYKSSFLFRWQKEVDKHISFFTSSHFIIWHFPSKYVLYHEASNGHYLLYINPKPLKYISLFSYFSLNFLPHSKSQSTVFAHMLLFTNQNPCFSFSSHIFANVIPTTITKTWQSLSRCWNGPTTLSIFTHYFVLWIELIFFGFFLMYAPLIYFYSLIVPW